MNFADAILNLPEYYFVDGDISICPISDDDDLWYAVVECRLLPEQEEMVNPAGFTIGRAWLEPHRHLPCIIRAERRRVGYMILREWSDGSATSWSYYIDVSEQGKGDGKAAAALAVRLLKAAFPNEAVKLSTGQINRKAQRLYEGLGFVRSEEMDGDDLVFVHL